MSKWFFPVLKRLGITAGKSITKQEILHQKALSFLNALCDDGFLSAKLDWSSLLDRSKYDMYENNCICRQAEKRHSNLVKLYDQLVKLLDTEIEGSAKEKYLALAKQMHDEAFYLPNLSHPNVATRPEDKARTLSLVGSPKEDSVSFESICEKAGMLRVSNMGRSSTSKSYAFYGDLALLEKAVIKFALDKFARMGFQQVYVPDVVGKEVVAACGFPVYSLQNSIFEINEKLCLAGTSEMTLADYVRRLDIRKSSLPLLLTACSRCYRAEISTREHKGPLYRVHEFYKVEMFVVTAQDVNISNEWHKRLCSIQSELYKELGLCFRVLDMPSGDLGLPAYRKFDIEAWIPSKKTFGEISSTSNCTDFQSRRLNITYEDDDGQIRYPHTLNATGVAVPRVLSVLVETHYDEEKKCILVPDCLIPYMQTSWIALPKPPFDAFWVKLLENKTGCGVLTYDEAHNVILESRETTGRKL